MKTKVIYQERAGYPQKEYEGADEVNCFDGVIRVYRKGKCIAVHKAMRRGNESLGWAWVVREKKKRWRLKLVKE